MSQILNLRLKVLCQAYSLFILVLYSPHLFLPKRRLLRPEDNIETNHQLKKLRFRHMHSVCKECVKEWRHCGNRRKRRSWPRKR